MIALLIAVAAPMPLASSGSSARAILSPMSAICGMDMSSRSGLSRSARLPGATSEKPAAVVAK